MTTEQLRLLHHAKPFIPFVIHLADGTSVPVRHPELLLISQGGRTVIVNLEGEQMAIVDVLLITKLSMEQETLGPTLGKM